MSKPKIQFVEDDWSNVNKHFESRGVVLKREADRLEVSRGIHRCVMSLLIWRLRLRKIPQHGMLFINELASDGVQVLPQVIGGYRKCARLLVRGVLENLFRHVYFVDHPIEFMWLHGLEKWYMSWDHLTEYASRHGALAKCLSTWDFASRARSLYARLSEDVHGRAIDHLEMRIALADIRYDRDDARQTLASLIGVTEIVNIVLAVLYRSQLLGFSPEERKAVLRQIPQGMRRVIRDAEIDDSKSR